MASIRFKATYVIRRPEKGKNMVCQTMVKQLTISALYIHTPYYTTRIAIKGGYITSYLG